eukprot:CAMPEP_0168751046 /NCGR_PEP_ID=MMETSP0724-20121128/17610_1 /TAXON_ID=265536 /ORGANISM="Amphiprora sp., Strain CCMP467" /LENGTH=657 /DNA_ID=CAMNT_0008799135 /DNA_START=312 /DNA_END=2285 /DNA_ORIENTATION=-
MIPNRIQALLVRPQIDNLQAGHIQRLESSLVNGVKGQFDDASEDNDDFTGDDPICFSVDEEAHHSSDRSVEEPLPAISSCEQKDYPMSMQSKVCANWKRRPDTLKQRRQKKSKTRPSFVDLTTTSRSESEQDDDDDDSDDAAPITPPSYRRVSPPAQQDETVRAPGTNCVQDALALVTTHNLPPEMKPMPQNDPHHASSKYLGVSHNGITWKSTIHFQGTNYDLGTFYDEWNAGAIYTWAYFILYGDKVLAQIRSKSRTDSSSVPEPIPSFPDEKSIRKALSVVTLQGLPRNVKPIIAHPESRGLTLRSAYAGVVRRASRWESSISFQGKEYMLGTFSSEWEAGAVHAWAFKILRGECAYSRLATDEEVQRKASIRVESHVEEETRNSRPAPNARMPRPATGIVESVEPRFTALQHPSAALIPNQRNGFSTTVPRLPEVHGDEDRKHPISNLTVRDVLYGRGGFAHHHVGNKWYRSLIGQYQKVYLELPKYDKSQLSKNLVNYIRWRGGRFLFAQKGRGGSLVYFEAGDARAVGKMSQGLREVDRSIVANGDEGKPSSRPPQIQNKLILCKKRPVTLPKTHRSMDEHVSEEEEHHQSPVRDVQKLSVASPMQKGTLRQTGPTTPPTTAVDDNVSDDHAEPKVARPNAARSMPDYLLF